MSPKLRRPDAPLPPSERVETRRIFERMVERAEQYQLRTSMEMGLNNQDVILIVFRKDNAFEAFEEAIDDHPPLADNIEDWQVIKECIRASQMKLPRADFMTDDMSPTDPLKLLQGIGNPSLFEFIQNEDDTCFTERITRDAATVCLGHTDMSIMSDEQWMEIKFGLIEDFDTELEHLPVWDDSIDMWELLCPQ